MSAGTVVVLNPRSGNGATARIWGKLEPRLREKLGTLEVETTRSCRDAERIARAAARGGAKRLVVAGGDGTASEVASGLLSSGLAGQVKVSRFFEEPYPARAVVGVAALPLGVPVEIEAVLKIDNSDYSY